MKLSKWAKQQGISYRTAWHWFKLGTLPVSAKQLANGTILIAEQDQTKDLVGIYAQVSSSAALS